MLQGNEAEGNASKAIVAIDLQRLESRKRSLETLCSVYLGLCFSNVTRNRKLYRLSFKGSLEILLWFCDFDVFVVVFFHSESEHVQWHFWGCFRTRASVWQKCDKCHFSAYYTAQTVFSCSTEYKHFQIWMTMNVSFISRTTAPRRLRVRCRVHVTWGGR